MTNPDLKKALTGYKRPFYVDGDSVVDQELNCVSYNFGFNASDIESAEVIANAIAEFLNSTMEDEGEDCQHKNGFEFSRSPLGMFCSDCGMEEDYSKRCTCDNHAQIKCDKCVKMEYEG